MSKNLSYREIRLLKQNPRYTRSIDIDLLNINYGNNYDISDVIKELLSYEGDWYDLLNLLEQLIQGYNSAMDQIFVLKGKDNKYYSIEGNRRIMCMYLLIEFEKYERVLIFFSTVKYYKEVIDILKLQNKPNFENLNITELENISDEDDIWKVIYTRHAGENKGKRSWSRLKYFYDLKDMFYKYQKDNLDNKEIKKRLSYRFNKTIKTIDGDLNSCLWVTDVVSTYNELNNNKEKKININEDSERISSLELARSNIKIEYNDELKTLTKLFEISVNVSSWKVEIKVGTKNELYNFLIDNLLAENYTTRGWKGETIYILYEFIIKYLEPDLLGTGSTLRQEIELAQQIPEIERTKTQEQLVKYSNHIDILKKIQKQLIENTNRKTISTFSSIKTKTLTGIKWGLAEIWKNNLNPLFNTLKIKSKNYPFLISSTIIRSSWELLATFAILKSPTFRKKILHIWENLNTNEKNILENKIRFLKKDDIEIESSILKKFKNYNIFEIVKLNIQKQNIKAVNILDMIYSDMKINSFEEKYKILRMKISNLDVYVTGEYNRIPNTIIHSYYFLENDKHFERAWTSLNDQLSTLIPIINIWILDSIK